MPPPQRDNLPFNVGDFKLSITRALADQLLSSLAKLRAAPLTNEALNLLQSRPGIYELWVDNERKYVGKASRSLPQRLRKHWLKLSGRQGIDITGVRFLCLYVDEDLEASAPERMLIAEYRRQSSVPWNTNGFGNNDPGRRRDHTIVEAGNFDAMFSIDLDVSPGLPAGDYRVGDLLTMTKKALPFLLRMDKDLPKKAISRQSVTIGQQASLRDLLKVVIDALPEGWQATALPGYVILYEEWADYPSATFVCRRLGGQVLSEALKPSFEDRPVHDESESAAGDEDGDAGEESGFDVLF